MHPYQALPVRQRNIQECSDSVMSMECLPEAIFRFLDLSEVNIALREEEPKLYIIMFSNPSLPLIVSATYWARLGELESMYRIKTMTTRHQCIIRSTVRTPRTLGVPNDYLNPNSSSMKLVPWNYQGPGNVAFCNHAHELYCSHRPQILIIVEPHIAEDWAQTVIDTLPYSHSQRVDSIGFLGGIWMLWNEGRNLKVEMLTTSEYIIPALVKVPSQSRNFLLTAIYASPNFKKRKML